MFKKTNWVQQRNFLKSIVVPIKNLCVEFDLGTMLQGILYQITDDLSEIKTNNYEHDIGTSIFLNCL